MIVYAFTPNNVYSGELEVEGPGWPSNSTPVSPHPIPEGHYAVCNFGAWTYVAGDPPPYPTPEMVAQQNKNQAKQLLSDTDWTCTVDITNPEYSNPYLMNQDAFLAYRSQVRAIAVNPPTTLAQFPEKPQEVWSSQGKNTQFFALV